MDNHQITDHCVCTGQKGSCLTCRTGVFKNFSFNPDWCLLKGLKLAPYDLSEEEAREEHFPRWIVAFDERQQHVGDMVRNSLFLLPLVLVQIVATYAIRKWTDFEVGDIIKVIDTEENSLGATILEIRHDEYLYIHYLGWKAFWDEWIPMKSPRVREPSFVARVAVWGKMESLMQACGCDCRE